MYSCSARLKTADFERNSSGRTQIYEYSPPPPLPPSPLINALVTLLLVKFKYFSSPTNIKLEKTGTSSSVSATVCNSIAVMHSHQYGHRWHHFCIADALSSPSFQIMVELSDWL